MSEIVEAMMKPSTYDEKVKNIRMIQTHISWVFLTGEYVYKIKKPVNFEFLDFTTLEKRKYYCEEELRLNRRLCKEIYLGVVPLKKSEAGIKIKGEGETIEYAVKMKQLPQEAIMSELLKKGEVTQDDVEEIANILANFHKEADTGEEINEYGSIEQIKANWIQNFEQTRNIRGNIVDAHVFDFIETNVLRFIETNNDFFEWRVESGKIRECHGDLHSGNIFIIKNKKPKICIFDAIEFNKAFSCSDVASEVAFLAMDLEFHRKYDLAQQFVNKYVELTGDKKLEDLLPFYKCYRAYVRAKVASFKLFDVGVSDREKKIAKNLTKKYFNLAFQYSKELYSPGFTPYFL
jgi:hypothetical protein